ncbi:MULTISPECIES: hypothetical protein [unclassified Sinorhizobium]|uniref:hypothetical protein n=1 Tax=unclassified Sinorhizobium TaxID=2613772 RepID=UPI003523D79E
MSHDHDPHDKHKEPQALEKIQHSRANNEKQKPKRKAAVVADPRNRLVDGSVDPVTKEVKPAGE